MSAALKLIPPQTVLECELRDAIAEVEAAKLLQARAEERAKALLTQWGKEQGYTLRPTLAQAKLALAQ